MLALHDGAEIPANWLESQGIITERNANGEERYTPSQIRELFELSKHPDATYAAAQRKRILGSAQKRARRVAEGVRKAGGPEELQSRHHLFLELVAKIWANIDSPAELLANDSSQLEYHETGVDDDIGELEDEFVSMTNTLPIGQAAKKPPVRSSSP